MFLTIKKNGILICFTVLTAKYFVWFLWPFHKGIDHVDGNTKIPVHVILIKLIFYISNIIIFERIFICLKLTFVLQSNNNGLAILLRIYYLYILPTSLQSTWPSECYYKKQVSQRNYAGQRLPPRLSSAK